MKLPIGSVNKVRENEDAEIETPVEDAIDWCVENDVLREFLLERKDEVIKVMTIDMTFEAREEIIRRNAHERGREEGREEGRTEGGREMLISLVNEGVLDIATAAMKAGMQVEDFEKLLTL